MRSLGRGRQGIGRVAPFLVLFVLILVIFRLYPILEDVRLSLTNSKGYGDYDYIGLQNYVTAFQDVKFITSVKNSFLLILVTPFVVGIALTLAIFLKERPWGWKFFRFALFLPAVLSPVVLGTYFGKILQFKGPVNMILESLGLGFLVRDWLGDPKTALPTLLTVIVWAGLGVGVLIFLSAMGSIDTELFDAAKVDGAGWLRQQFVVTIPALRPTIAFYAIITVIGSFTATFPYVFVLTRGGPGYLTFVAEYAIYESAFENGQFGYAAAQGLILFALIGLIVFLFTRFTNRMAE